jgi:hypothetical protein
MIAKKSIDDDDYINCCDFLSPALLKCTNFIGTRIATVVVQDGEAAMLAWPRALLLDRPWWCNSL